MKIPGVYDGTRQTNFTATYNGSRGDQLFDQYGTVAMISMRSGDFSSLSTQLFDPATGAPFAANQIPAARMSAASLSLLRFIPAANVESATRNYHQVTTTSTVSDNVNVRVTHNFRQAAGRGRPGRPRRRGRWAAGRGGRGAQAGISVNLTAQLQY